MNIVVVLPAPLCPSSAVMSPSYMSTFSLSTAGRCFFAEFLKQHEKTPFAMRTRDPVNLGLPQKGIQFAYYFNAMNALLVQPLHHQVTLSTVPKRATFLVNRNWHI